MTYTEFFLSLCILLLSSASSLATTQTLTTYYPAPQGNYKNMTVGSVLQLTSQATDCVAGANATIVDFNGALDLCDANGKYNLTSTSLWQYNGTYLSPWTPGEAVSIGAANGTAGYALTVTGSSKFTANSVLGTNDGNTTTINGNAILGNDLGSTLLINGQSEAKGNFQVDGALSSQTTLSVLGNSTLGTNDGNSTVINGNAILGNDLGSTLMVNGQTEFKGSAQIDGTTQLNSNVTVAANASLNGNTTIAKMCNGTGCGPLAMDCSTGTCYAAYAP